MSFLMSITIAYNSLLTTEIQIQDMLDSSDRSLDAAFTGAQYVLSALHAKKDTFMSDLSKRTYFVEADDSSGTKLRAGWYYLDENMGLLTDGEPTKSYRFRVTSYKNPDASLSTWTYIIKSQGQYLQRLNDTVIATHTSQIIANAQIDYTRKKVKLTAWRMMPYQTNDADFFNDSEEY